MILTQEQKAALIEAWNDAATREAEALDDMDSALDSDNTKKFEEASNRHDRALFNLEGMETALEALGIVVVTDAPDVYHAVDIEIEEN